MYDPTYPPLLLSMLYDLGYPIKPEAILLDFGCGEGKQVYDLRKVGYRVYGIDVQDRSTAVLERCREEGLCGWDEGIFHTIDQKNYSIPFSDGTVDVVFSNQVLEHVWNWCEVLAEIHRVLNPEGCSLHILPAKYRPFESHVRLPFGGTFQSYKYAAFWAWLGLRSNNRKGLSWSETAELNHRYLTLKTNYLTRSRMSRYVLAQFGNVKFVEDIFLKNTYSHSRLLRPIVKIIPPVAPLFGTFQTTVLFFYKQAKMIPPEKPYRLQS
jgi:SAM-dependent methyltransferase